METFSLLRKLSFFGTIIAIVIVFFITVVIILRFFLVTVSLVGYYFIVLYRILYSLYTILYTILTLSTYHLLYCILYSLNPFTFTLPYPISSFFIISTVSIGFDMAYFWFLGCTFLPNPSYLRVFRILPINLNYYFLN